MLTQESLMAVLEHERSYGGPRRHFFGQPSAPRRPISPASPPQKWEWNEKGEVRCYSLARDCYEWVRPIWLARQFKREKRRKPA